LHAKVCLSYAIFRIVLLYEPSCSVSVVPVQHRTVLFVLYQAEPTQRVDCLAPRWEIWR